MKIHPIGAVFFHANGRTDRRIDKTKIPVSWQIPCITSRSTPSVAVCCTNWIVVCISYESRHSARPTNGSKTAQHSSVQASRAAPFPASYPAAAGCSAARLLARPTSDTQVVTRLCKSDIAKNVSFSCYITGRKVKGKVRPACTTACNWRPTAGVRSKQLRAAGCGLFGRRWRGGGQGPKFGFLLRLQFLKSFVIFLSFLLYS